MLTCKRTTFWVFIFSVLIMAQSEDTTSIISNQLLENLIPEPIENNEEFNLVDYLEEFEREPININTADASMLAMIPGLDMNYTKLILEYRQRFGRFFSTDELFSIKGLPEHLIKDIKYFVTVDEAKRQQNEIKPSLNRFRKNGNINFRSRLSYNLNNINNIVFDHFAGSKIKLYNRLTISNKKWQAGIITEKDPGENSYYDFSSFHLLVKDQGILDKVILGDYIFEFGQGLVISRPFSFSKTSDVTFPLKKKNGNIHAYNSTDENRFLRGLAVSVKMKYLNLSLFYSDHKIDASLDSIKMKILSFNNSGYHRTNLEIDNQHSAREIILGCSGGFSFNDLFHFGVLFFTTKFNKPLSGNLLPTFERATINYISTSYESNPIESINISGETAYDFNSLSTLTTLQILFNKDFIYFSSIRYYPSNFISLHGNCLSEQKSKVQNETGFYNGFKLFTKYGSINFSFDQFKFPLGSSGLPISNSGEEFLLSYMGSIKDKISVKLNYKNEDKDILLDLEDKKSMTRRRRNDLRFVLSWDFLKDIKIKSLTEYNSIRIEEKGIKEDGILLGNSLIINIIKDVRINTSFSFFRTDSFFSSVYEYDTNIKGLLRGEFLYGEGMKIKIYFEYIIIAGLNLSTQYSEIIKPRGHTNKPNYSDLYDNITFQMEYSF
jgi:hypothetical protein